MQTNPLGPPSTEKRSSDPRNFNAETAADSAIVIHIFIAAIAGAIAYVAAIMTTTVYSGGFWRDFWLGICVAMFIFSFISLVLAIGRFSFRESGSNQGS
jgi:hypothetical protein